MSNNVVQLNAARDDRLQKLIEIHRATLAELVSAFAVHTMESNLTTMHRFLDAQDAFVAAYLALET